MLFRLDKTTCISALLEWKFILFKNNCCGITPNNTSVLFFILGLEEHNYDFKYFSHLIIYTLQKVIRNVFDDISPFQCSVSSKILIGPMRQ